ncbi:MAG: MurT ligase domain-containing protein [Methanobacterium sp.]
MKIVGMNATALPGKVALKLDPKFLSTVNTRCKKKVIITGTNGKTTTNNLINHILNSEYDDVLSNLRGANMPQGVASAFLNDKKNEYDWGVFEVDEGSFPDVVKYIKPDYVVITNFFRDQLDRFGEIENTAKIVYEALKPLNTTLILNADDPMVSKFKDLGKRSIYYGVEKSKFSTLEQRVVESRFCPVCSCSLDYEYYNYGQLGKYVCSSCGFKNPEYDYKITSVSYCEDAYHFSVKSAKNNNCDVVFGYDGIYNAYNCCAAMAFSIEAGLDMEKVAQRIENFEYKLGRMENIEFTDKMVKIVLVKNPIGLSEVLKSISNDQRKKSILFILNDNPADGTDVSWIWDADVEVINNIKNLESIHCSGIRAQDIALRIKYAEYDEEIIEIDFNVEDSIETVIDEDVEIVYILPTYTAVFQTRDIVMGHLNDINARIPRLREIIKSKIGN